MTLRNTCLFIALAALASAGCGDDDPRPNPTTSTSGTTTTTDDTGGGDGDGDGDVEPTTATVTVTEDGAAPTDTITYVWSNADGSVISSAELGTDGVTTETVEAGAQFTILVEQAPDPGGDGDGDSVLGVAPTQFLSYTIQGVDPGDEIALSLESLGEFFGGGEEAQESGTVTATYEEDGFPAANAYLLSDGCNLDVFLPEAMPNVVDHSLIRDQACEFGENNDEFRLLAEATQIFANGLRDSVALALSPAITAGASPQAVVLPALSDTLAGVGVTISGVDAATELSLFDGTFTIDGVEFDPADDQILAGATLMGSSKYPGDVTPDSVSTLLTTIYFNEDDAAIGRAAILESQAGAGMDVTYDVSSDHVSSLTNLDVTLTLAEQTIAWTNGGDNSGADRGVTSLGWVIQDATPAITEEHRWVVLFDPAQSSATLPQLPDELAAFRLSAMSANISIAFPIVTDASFATGWDDVRAAGGDLGEPDSASFTVKTAVALQPPAPALAGPRIGPRSERVPRKLFHVKRGDATLMTR